MVRLSIPNLSSFSELFIEEKENSIIVKSQDFGKTDNLKRNKILKRLSKAIKKKFKDCVLVTSKIYENNYYNLVGFFEKQRVNFYFNLTTVSTKHQCNKEKDKK
jgi:hypothetical protein